MSQQYQQPYYQQQQGYQQPAYYQPAPPQSSGDSVGSWVLTIFLIGLPVVGLIYTIVLAAGDGSSIAKRNFARAYLIWMAIGIAIAIVFSVIMAVTGGVFFSTVYNQLENPTVQTYQ